ncbi:hypothetical protein U1Q18_049050 [Sarracenia purpurea var. burkii]
METEMIEVDDSLEADGEEGDFEALLLEVTARIEDALVLGLGDDNVALLVAVKMHDALDGDVVGIGGADGEDDLLRRGVDKGGAAATWARARSTASLDSQP